MRAVKALIVAALIFVLAAAAWCGYALFIDRSQPSDLAHIVIPRGATFRDVASELAAAHVVKYPLLFRLYAKINHADTDVHAGEFRFPPHQTIASVLAQLRSGGAQIARWVTIPEGFTAREIAARLHEQGFGPQAAFYTSFIHQSIVVGGKRTQSLEGYLFPSTYLVPLGATPRTVEQIFTAEFLRRLPADAARKAAARGLTVPQAVTLASLVEREAKADDERALMAGVYYNRLRLGMPLEVDAAIEYAFPEHHDVITYRDLKIDSPYNLYKHPGLPPTPIANPGMPSIIAALNPQPSDFLYYVYKGNGHHAFAKTLAQQTANVAKYLK